MKFGGRAGEVAGENQQHLAYVRYSDDLRVEDSPSEWAPFLTRMDWEVARWSKLRGPSSTALSELLKIDGVRRSFVPLPAVFLNTFFSAQLASTLGLSFSSADELNRIIDKKLPDGLPHFTREEVTLAGQTYEFYHRDIIQCIRVLYGDPELAKFLAHVPERHFTGPDKKTQVYSEMNSGKWWWTRQVCLYIFGI